MLVFAAHWLFLMVLAADWLFVTVLAALCQVLEGHVRISRLQVCLFLFDVRSLRHWKAFIGKTGERPRTANEPSSQF